MEESNLIRRIIDVLCEEKGIEKITLSYDWVIIFKKGDVEKKIVNYKFHLNPKRSMELASDKYSTYCLLKYYGIPIIEHQVLFNEEMMPNFAHVNDEFRCLKNEDKVVIKANRGSSQGRDVYVSSKPEEKVQIVNQIFADENDAVCICPYKDIEYEYRAIFLYGEMIYMYKKQKPFVIGNGKSTIGELIEENYQFFTEPIQNLDLNRVLEEGEKVTVGWKHNVSNGAIPIIIDEKDAYYDTVKNIAEKAGKALDLNYATVDVVVTKEKEVLVMEVNSNVCIVKFCELMPNGFEIGKEIFSKVIDKMFEN